MGRKKRRAASPARRAPKAAVDRPIEAREAVAVAWMLTAATTLAAEMGFGGLALAELAAPGAHALSTLKAVVGFACVVLGACTLALTGAASIGHCGPAPRSLTLGAIAVGSAPLAALLGRWAIGSG